MENYRTSGENGGEIGRLFEDFCHERGISAEFDVTFGQTLENGGGQCTQVKPQTSEAESRIVIKNVKPSSETSDSEEARKIAAIKAETRAVIAEYGAVTTPSDLSAEKLSAEFNAFLKQKGVADNYSVQVVKE